MMLPDEQKLYWNIILELYIYMCVHIYLYIYTRQKNLYSGVDQTVTITSWFRKVDTYFQSLEQKKLHNV